MFFQIKLPIEIDLINQQKKITVYLITKILNQMHKSKTLNFCYKFLDYIKDFIIIKNTERLQKMSQQQVVPILSSPTPSVYEVQRILQRGKAGNQTFYLVQWKGYSDKDATWQPLSNLEDCKQAIDEFEKIIKDMENIYSEDVNDAKSNKSKSSKSKTKSGSITKDQIKKLKKKKQSIKNQQKSQSQQKIVLPEENKKQLTDKPRKSFIQQKQVNDSRHSSQRQVNTSKKLNSTALKNSKLKLQSSEDNQSDHFQPTTAQTIPTIKQEYVNKKYAIKKSDFPFVFESDEDEDLKLTIVKQEVVQQKIDRNINKQKTSFNSDQISSLKRNKSTLNQSSQERQDELLKKKVKKDLPEDKKLTVISQKQKPDQVFENTKETNNQGNKSIVPYSKTQNTSKVHCKLQNKEIESSTNVQVYIKTHISQVSTLKFVQQHKSHRYALCEQYLNDQKIQTAQQILSLFQCSSLSIANNMLLTPKFHDLTGIPTNKLAIKNLESLILSTSEVHLLDQQGEFLYAKFLQVIKFHSKKSNSTQWICLIECDCPVIESKKEKDETINHLINPQKFHLVRVEDLKEDIWKRKFRKFTEIIEV